MWKVVKYVFKSTFKTENHSQVIAKLNSLPNYRTDGIYDVAKLTRF